MDDPLGGLDWSEGRMLAAYEEGGRLPLDEDDEPSVDPPPKPRKSRRGGSRSGTSGKGALTVRPEPTEDPSVQDGSPTARGKAKGKSQAQVTDPFGQDGLPTPDERAELVVRELESVLRGHRSKSMSGMRMSDWKSAAREIVLAELREAEESRSRHLIHTNRWILMGSATVVSIGFWAAVYQVDKAYNTGAAVMLGLFGIVLIILGAEWGLRKAVRMHLRGRRIRLWGEIATFDGRLKRLRKEIESQIESLEETSEEARKLRGKLWGGIRKRD